MLFHGHAHAAVCSGPCHPMTLWAPINWSLKTMEKESECIHRTFWVCWRKISATPGYSFVWAPTKEPRRSSYCVCDRRMVFYQDQSTRQRLQEKRHRHEQRTHLNQLKRVYFPGKKGRLFSYCENCKGLVCLKLGRHDANVLYATFPPAAPSNSCNRTGWESQYPCRLCMA